MIIKNINAAILQSIGFAAGTVSIAGRYADIRIITLPPPAAFAAGGIGGWTGIARPALRNGNTPAAVSAIRSRIAADLRVLNYRFTAWRREMSSNKEHREQGLFKPTACLNRQAHSNGPISVPGKLLPVTWEKSGSRPGWLPGLRN